MLHNQSIFARCAAVRPPQVLAALVLALLLLTSAPAVRDAAAAAPPLANVVVETSVYAAPDIESAIIATVPAGSEIELTGRAAPGFLEVLYNGDPVWISAQYLSLGIRPGIDTAVTTRDTPLLDAPMPDAGVLATVPQDETVILTGAHVDGYDAAAHDDVGGWINERDIAR